MTGPLSGVRVIDLTSVVSGPFATMFLADQGADVIKVEPPGGDITRRSRQSVDPTGQFSALFISTNRGKRSLSVDLKQPEGIEILRKLIARSDVLVQNFRPQVMERLGLGEAGHARAQSAPDLRLDQRRRRQRTLRREAHLRSRSSRACRASPTSRPRPETRRPQMIRTIVADKTTSVFTAQAVASALYAREKTGVGQHIKVAMLDVMISYLWPEAMMQYTVVGQEAAANDPKARPDLIFQTLDGYMTAGTISDSEWQGFCRAAEQPALIEDKRFNTPAARTANASRAHPPDGRHPRQAHHGRLARRASTRPTCRARRSCAAAR